MTNKILWFTNYDSEMWSKFKVRATRPVCNLWDGRSVRSALFSAWIVWKFTELGPVSDSDFPINCVERTPLVCHPMVNSWSQQTVSVVSFSLTSPVELPWECGKVNREVFDKLQYSFSSDWSHLLTASILPHSAKILISTSLWRSNQDAQFWTPIWPKSQDRKKCTTRYYTKFAI